MKKGVRDAKDDWNFERCGFETGKQLQNNKRIVERHWGTNKFVWV